MLKKICYRNIWLLIVSLLLITSGVYVLFNPLSALIASVLIIGILFIILGSSYILAFKDGDSYAILALGILDVFIGLLFSSFRCTFVFSNLSLLSSVLVSILVC